MINAYLVTGILDATSKAAEGIKNSTIGESKLFIEIALKIDERPNENWVRYPRVFYGSEKFIKIYSELDANLIFCL